MSEEKGSFLFSSLNPLRLLEWNYKMCIWLAVRKKHLLVNRLGFYLSSHLSHICKTVKAFQNLSQLSAFLFITKFVVLLLGNRILYGHFELLISVIDTKLFLISYKGHMRTILWDKKKNTLECFSTVRKYFLYRREKIITRAITLHLLRRIK